MEKSFDFGSLLKSNEKKRKVKPTQFVSFAGGVLKRLQTNIQNRKSTRLTIFDSIRELPQCESPAPPKISKAQQKMAHRRQQLEKWKCEREQKKKEEAARKKKPFLAGKAPSKIPRSPPIKPSTSERVTRSQTRNAAIKQKEKCSPDKPSCSGKSLSFAPNDAAFKPPQIKNLVRLPKLVPPTKNQNRIASMITFEPVIPQTAKQNKSRPHLTRQNATETKYNPHTYHQTETRTTRGKGSKKLPPPKFLSSSSGSDIEAKKRSNCKTRIQTPAAKKTVRNIKQLTPKVLAMESTSQDSCSDSSMGKQSKRKSLRNCVPSPKYQSSSDKCTSDELSSVEHATVASVTSRKTSVNNSSPRCQANSSSEKVFSDPEDLNKSPKINTSVVTRNPSAVTPNNRVPKSESSSEEKLRSSKSPQLQLTPEQLDFAKCSPCVTMLRGKTNAVKEFKWKNDEGLLDEDASTDSVDYFRSQLSSEMKRMTEMCETWDKISMQVVLPEPVQEAIWSAVGQARLLMSKKLVQFADLIEQCAQPKPTDMLVTPADLRGFWDMIFMQVENIDIRFKKLEELRSRNWIEEAPVQEKKAVAARPVAKKICKPAGAVSRIREMIAAARQAKRQQENPQSPLVQPPAEGEKTFEAGFFSVRSPVRSPAVPSPGTPAPKSNLLKAVLSSEANKSAKKAAASLAMLRATQSARGSPLRHTPQMNPINIHATPGRSILKSTNIDEAKSEKRSIKVVLFHASESDSNENSTVFETNNKNDTFQSALDVKQTKEQDDRLETSQNKENTLAPEMKVAQPRSRSRSKENAKSPETTIVRTRSQRKSANLSAVEPTEEVKTPRRSSRKKKVDADAVDAPKTHSRASGKKKAKESEQSEEKSKKRSTSKITLQVTRSNDTEKAVSTPRRSSTKNRLTLRCICQSDCVCCTIDT